jgi:hypothetical protein
MRDLMLAVALCGRFERDTFLRNDGNYITNDTSSATPNEHNKINNIRNWRAISANNQH